LSSFHHHETLPAHATSVDDPVRGWLWWNVLSADAPAVAAAWALLFAHARHLAVPAATVATLAIAVWLIYVLDRLLDGWTSNAPALKTRHLFYKRHRALFFLLLVPAAVLCAWLVCVTLDVAEIRDGLLLGAIVALYMLCIHAVGDPLSRLLLKEVAVGVIFAAGTTLPIWSQPSLLTPRAIFAWLIFALLCVLNCIAIESWEKNPAFLALPGARRAEAHVTFFALALASLACIAHTVFRADAAVCIAIASSALLTALLDRARSHLTANSLRVLADLALLAPAVLALAFHLR
jgi:hypothetical protein